MPVKNAKRSTPASNFYKSVSFETLAASWFTADGWEVFMPLVDHGSKTDILIGDDHNFYRIQIKSLELNDESQVVHNQWGDVGIDFVIYFCKTSHWGYIAPPFKEKSRKVNDQEHIRFHRHEKHFAKAFKRA